MISSMRKKALVAFALLSFCGSAFGYAWTFNNLTDKILMVAMKLTGKGNARFWHLLGPNETVTFEWDFPYCYSSIRLTEYNREDALLKTRSNLFSDLKHVSYGDNSNPTVLKYFDTKIWRTPMIIYPKSDFDVTKIVDALQAVGTTGEAAAKAAGAAATGGAGAAMAGADLGLGSLIGSMTGLIVEGIQKGACISRELDIRAAKLLNPATGQKENTYILINHTN